MRHIALITTSYPDNIPGTEAAGSFVEDFARELSGHMRVTVVAASTAETLSSDGALSVRRFAVPRVPLSLLSPLNPTHWPQIVVSLRSGRNALEQLVKEDRPDHILALWALPSGYWAERVGRDHALKYSVWALGSDIWGLGKVPLVRQVLKRVLRRADRRYADGLQLASDVEQLCGLPCEFLPSTRLLPSSGPAEKSREAPYKLAFLGRWHKNKGIDLLLDALGQLTEQDWSKISSVRIYGGGPLHEEVHAVTRELVQGGRPVFVGAYLDKEAAAELIGWADYLLLPSRIESIPVIFSDAVQVGTPIIATPVGDLPRLHAKYSFGLIAEGTDSASYSRALQAALGVNANDFDKGMEAARVDFDLETIVKRFVQDAVSC
jgi:glycosyltransferase involved in cell wall biosynthesis